MRPRKGNLSFLVLIAAIAMLPVLTSNSYVISIMCFVAIYGTLALGMGVLLEHAGIFSLAHPTWFGLGAYFAGIVAIRGIAPAWAGILIGAVCVGLIAYLIGAPLLRLKGYYLTCASFAVLLIFEITFAQFSSITGGHEGLMGIPRLTIGTIVFRKDIHYYYLSWGLCLACFCFLYNLMNSRIGRAIESLHDSEVASSCMGINVARFRLLTFILTAVMASLAGSVFCFYIRFTMPTIYGFALLLEVLTMIVIGGGKKLYGPLVGAFIMIWLRELLHGLMRRILPVMTSEVDAIFFGIAVIVILIFAPHGLSGSLAAFVNKYRRSA
ncbi:MAG: branched-chain amino acid ABC transporter permease [Syntrophales bacterium]